MYISSDCFLLPPTCFLSLYFQKWWTPSQTARFKGSRGCPSWLNTAPTFGASWRPCLSRTGLSWWSGSPSWPTSESSTRCWFSLPSRTSWWSYWTCTGWLLYARTTDPPAVEPTRAALAFDESAQGDKGNRRDGEMLHPKIYSYCRLIKITTGAGKEGNAWFQFSSHNPLGINCLWIIYVVGSRKLWATIFLHLQGD